MPLSLRIALRGMFFCLVTRASRALTRCCYRHPWGFNAAGNGLGKYQAIPNQADPAIQTRLLGFARFGSVCLTLYEHKPRQLPSYLVGTTHYLRSTGGEECRVIASANNALCFFAARFLSPSIRLCASCNRRRLVFVACRLAYKDLSHRSK